MNAITGIVFEGGVMGVVGKNNDDEQYYFKEDEKRKMEKEGGKPETVCNVIGGLIDSERFELIDETKNAVIGKVYFESGGERRRKSAHELSELDRPSEGIDFMMSYVGTEKANKCLKKEEEEEVLTDSGDEEGKMYPDKMDKVGSEDLINDLSEETGYNEDFKLIMKGVMEMAIIFGARKGVMEMVIIFGAALVIYAGSTVHTRKEHLGGRQRRRIVMMNELAYEKRAAKWMGEL